MPLTALSASSPSTAFMTRPASPARRPSAPPASCVSTVRSAPEGNWSARVAAAAGQDRTLALGIALALAMAAWRPVGRALSPALIVSQTIPVFALAPILTLWLGFGLAPKIAMVVLIVFVPVAQALYDGLMAPPAAQMDVARVMGAGRWAMLRHLRLPAALPRLASGLRLGAIYAPVGAVIGEWVGGARGLGALMIQANGRMKTDLMFAALIVVVALSLTIYRVLDRALAGMLARRGF